MTQVTAETVSLGEFTFECGETIPDLQIAYEAYGEFDGENAVLVCHALTGSQNVAELGDTESGQDGQAAAWWHEIVGPGKAIDTDDYYVVCANVPGSCYGSSGPASPAPEGRGAGDHGRWGPAFPAVTVGDWTRAQRRLLDVLGVDRLRAVVGGSVGGMNALEWVARYPEDVELVAPIASAPRLDTQCLGLDAVARRAIRSDANWNGGTTTTASRHVTDSRWPASSVTSCTSRRSRWTESSAARRQTATPRATSFRPTPPANGSPIAMSSPISTTRPPPSSGGSTRTPIST
ncbi:alpha/beta fold hydrolase [Halovenus salina]|uniref:homoserine O-acetyltransferase n=1 Tax=Halovenus salina TaxID=1510225 RepID=A0ABD5W0W7_9EURY